LVYCSGKNMTPTTQPRAVSSLSEREDWAGVKTPAIFTHSPNPGKSVAASGSLLLKGFLRPNALLEAGSPSAGSRFPARPAMGGL
jgi:hypothetical protein